MSEASLTPPSPPGPAAVNAAWNGAGMQLLVNQSAAMPQTPDGTLVFGYFNMATQNNAGELSLSSGGGAPTFLTAQALWPRPQVLTANWRAGNLLVTNISANPATPIWISAYGPGVPGQYPGALPAGTPVKLATTQSAQGATSPQAMQLVLSVLGPTLGVFAVVGGPPDATGGNGYVISVNDAQESGPGTGTAPPPGYYATTTGNSYTLSFNWGGATLYVVNMSASTATVGQALLRAL